VVGRSRRIATRGQVRQESGKQTWAPRRWLQDAIEASRVSQSYRAPFMAGCKRGGVDGESDAVASGLDRTSCSFGHVAAHDDLFWTQTWLSRAWSRLVWSDQSWKS
jgi:hypothetical protein